MEPPATAEAAQGRERQATCPRCAAAVAPGDRFCEACGAELGGAGAGERPPCLACGGRAFSDEGYCERCGLRQPGEGDRVAIDLGAAAAGLSDRGLRHHRNEDAMALTLHSTPEGAPAVVAVVCDGVSSSTSPERASQAAAGTAAAILGRAVESGADPERATREAAAAAADAVRQLAVGVETAALAREGEVQEGAPSTTYLSALVADGRVTVGWLGDSRAYWLAEGGAAATSRVLTADDSWAREMAQRGELSEEEAYADARAHAITRWLGRDADDHEPHVASLEPGGPGALLLCSDGLWNYVADPAELASAALPEALGAPAEAVAGFVRTALESGGRDNVTVVLVPFPPRGAS